MGKQAKRSTHRQAHRIDRDYASLNVLSLLTSRSFAGISLVRYDSGVTLRPDAYRVKVRACLLEESAA